MTLERLRDFIRPISVAALIFVLLSGAVISGVMEAIMPGLGARFTEGVAGWFRAIPDTYYTLTGAMGGIYMALREAGKWKQVDAVSKGGAPDFSEMPAPQFGKE